MEIIFKHPWIFLIAITCANAFVLRYRSKKHIAQNPALKEGYNKFFKGILVYGNIPWVIMMLGNIGGLTQSTFEFLNPKTLNPIVLLFHASIVILWILAAWWIYFKKGAEFLETHPGLMQKSVFSQNTNFTAKQVKIFFPLMIAGGVFALIMLWTKDFPTPPL